MFSSSFFFDFCAFLILMGMVVFVWFYFDGRTSEQNKILREIAETQRIAQNSNDKLVNLQKEVEEVKKSNENLVQSVCILQDQIKSLGAVPIIDRDPICDEVKL